MTLQLPPTTNWLRARSGRVYVGDALNQIPADPDDVFGLMQDGATVVHPPIEIDPFPEARPTAQDQAPLPTEAPIAAARIEVQATPDPVGDLFHEAG